MHQNSRRYIKAFPKFECNIYSDIDFQSAISVSSTGNGRSLSELTDRLAFVNFSSPGDNNKLHKLHILFDNRLFHKLMLFTLLLVEGIYGTANQAVFSSNLPRFY